LGIIISRKILKVLVPNRVPSLLVSCVFIKGWFDAESLTWLKNISEEGPTLHPIQTRNPSEMPPKPKKKVGLKPRKVKIRFLINYYYLLF